MRQFISSAYSINNERGIALLLVLWIITLLTVICSEFSRTMRTESVITRNFKEGEQAIYVAKAGINKAIVELMRGINQPRSSIETEPKEEEEEEAPVWEPGMEPFRFAFAEHTCEISIEDENNKVNINAFLREAKKNPALLKALLEQKIGLEGEERDIVADSMIDWWDKDREITGVNGTERDYYLSLDDPHECRDGDLPVIEDLLLVRGIDEQMYYGDSGSPSQASLLAPEELEAILKGEDNADIPESAGEENSEEIGEKRNIGLVNIFSVYSSSKNFKIDINTASIEQLLLLDGIDTETAREIVRTRKEGRFQALTDRLPEFKNYEIWSKEVTLGRPTGAHFYKINCRGFVGTTIREIICTVLITRNNFFFMNWQEAS